MLKCTYCVRYYFTSPSPALSREGVRSEEGKGEGLFNEEWQQAGGTDVAPIDLLSGCLLANYAPFCRAMTHLAALEECGLVTRCSRRCLQGACEVVDVVRSRSDAKSSCRDVQRTCGPTPHIPPHTSIILL